MGAPLMVVRRCGHLNKDAAMPTRTRSNRRKSLLPSTLLVLSLLTTGYVGGAIFYAAPSRGVSPTFAPPAEMAAPDVQIQSAPPATVKVAPRPGNEWEPVPEPRECDLANGISTACLFLD